MLKTPLKSIALSISLRTDGRPNAARLFYKKGRHSLEIPMLVALLVSSCTPIAGLSVLQYSVVEAENVTSFPWEILGELCTGFTLHMARCHPSSQRSRLCEILVLFEGSAGTLPRLISSFHLSRRQLLRRLARLRHSHQTDANSQLVLSCQLRISAHFE